MAIVSSNERPVGRTADEEAEFRTFTRVFIVVTDDVGDGPVAARLAAGIPNIGDGHPAEPFKAFCFSIVPNETSSRLIFEVVCQYSTDPGVFAEDPTDAEPVISWSSVRQTVQIRQDIDGKPIQNAAGEDFEVGLAENVSIMEVTVVTNEDDYDPDFAEDMLETTNESQIQIAGKSVGPFKAKLVTFTGESSESGGVQFFKITKKLIFKGSNLETEESDTFDRKILNQGFNAKLIAGPTEKPVAILDQQGKEVDKPQNLKADGTREAAGVDANFIIFKTVPRRDFALLNIPTDL